MRIPQPPDRIKEAPAQALRAVFAGVGQVLLITERVRRKALGQEQSQPAAPGAAATSASSSTSPSAGTAAPARPAPSTTAAASPGTATTRPAVPAPRASTAKTTPAGPAKTRTAGTRPSTAKPSTPKPSTPKPRAASTPKPSPAKASTPKPTLPAGQASAEATGSRTLPVPHYSELTVASLRARLRGLDASQVRELLNYERAHEDRENVTAMFERRLAKLAEAD